MRGGAWRCVEVGGGGWRWVEVVWVEACILIHRFFVFLPRPDGKRPLLRKKGVQPTFMKACTLTMLPSVFLKMAGPIDRGNLTIKYDCPYLEKYSDSRKWIGFPRHSSRRPSFGTLKRTKFKNVLVMYLTENNPSLKWPLVYNCRVLKWPAP